MSRPLIPYSETDARALWHLLVDELEGRVCADAMAVRMLATECVAHLSLLLRVHPPGVRIVVLDSPDPGGLVQLAKVAAQAMDLPHAVVPLTSLSESGWAGRGLDKWLEALATDDAKSPWVRRGVVVLTGLDALRIQSGAYHASADATRDYRTGKSENLASLLRGEPTPYTHSGHAWDAERAMVIMTTTYERAEHDADALAAWGLTPELARLLASAAWIRVPEAEGVVAEREIRDALRPLHRTYEAFGVLLEVADETVHRAAMQAAQRGETAAAAASWIVEPARKRLATMLASGDVRTYVVIGPDDAIPPPVSRRPWVD